MPANGRGARPPLILYVAPYRARQRNAVAATLAWMAEAGDHAFEVYYDAVRLGRHYGSGETNGPDHGGLAHLTGGLVAGGRHLEAAAMVLQRFEVTAVCAGDVAFANLFAVLAGDAGAEIVKVAEDDVVSIYDHVLSHLGRPWPDLAVMLEAAPTPGLAGIDAYLFPEILYPRAVGVEAGASNQTLEALRSRGVGRIRTAGVSPQRQADLRRLGFDVEDLGLISPGDGFAEVTHRLAGRWADRRQGWLLGDPVLVSSWLPAACREHRTPIYGVPQSRVLRLLEAELATQSLPAVLGRQFHDSDFFTLSGMGQSFQVIDPCRPPLPVLQLLPSPWAGSAADPANGDPTDEELRDHARNRRILASLAFWTGMVREVENLYALMDLVAITGLRAGLVLTVPSLRYRPSPLDMLTVPRDQGGVFPHLEILLGSSGVGVSIESMLSPEQLALHLRSAQCQLDRLDLPAGLRPQGWWSTMDARLQAAPRPRVSVPVRVRADRPFVQIRFHARAEAARSPGPDEAIPGDGEAVAAAPPASWTHQSLSRLRRRGGAAIRGSRLESLFDAYRPYENFEPGPVLPDHAAAVEAAGLSYMLTKSGFGREPAIQYRHGDFVALNYTAGRWDGWTPFETVNDVSDLRRAERALIRRRRPGWLLGTIDTCLWAFSGELWHAAPRLKAIADHVAGGGASGELVNVRPCVLARYARIIDAEPSIG